MFGVFVQDIYDNISFENQTQKKNTDYFYMFVLNCDILV